MAQAETKTRDGTSKTASELPKPELRKVENRMPQWLLPSIKAGIIGLDALLALGCFAAAFAAREGAAIFSGSGWQLSERFAPYAAVALFAVPIRLLMLMYQRIYRLQGAFSYTDEAVRIFKAVSVGSLLMIAVAFLFRGGFAFRDFSYSRGVFLLDFVLAVFAFTAFHLLLRFAQTQARRRDINLIPTLIVGTNADAERCIAELAERPDFGYRVVGVVASDPTNVDDVSGVRVIGGLRGLPELIKQLAIQEVIITDSAIPHETLFEAMMKIGRRQRVEFRFAPNLFEVLPQKTSVDQIGVLPMVTLFREPLSDAERIVKRISDLAIAAVALIIVSPLWLLITILIKMDSRGAALFRQERVGMDGRIFLCYKFRTMRADADESIHREAYRKNIEGDAAANSGNEDKPVFGKVKNDPRVTRNGRWLRRASLDELPQLLNVLIGDMSVVGPRPPIPYEVEDYAVSHRKRLDMKPGITGLWQVSGRNRLTFEEMVRLDLYYIENWTLWLDLKIILLTIPAVFRGDGAR